MPVSRRPERIHTPASLQGCEWLPQRNHDTLYDGQILLAAVPVCDRSDRPEAGWHYEFDVIRICCGEDYFSVETMDGEPWGWEIDGVDFYVYVQI